MPSLHNNHSSRTPAAAPKKNGAAKKTSTSSTGSKKRKAPPTTTTTTSTQQEEEQQQQPQQKRQKRQPQPKRQKKQTKEAKVESRPPLLTPSSASAPEKPSVGCSVPVKPEGSDDTSSELKYPDALLLYRKSLQRRRRTPEREALRQKWLPLANQIMAAHVKKLAKLRAKQLGVEVAAVMKSGESKEKEEEVEVSAAGAASGAERLACCPHHEVEPSEEDDSDDDDDDDSDSDEDDWWHGKDFGWSRDEGMEYRDGQPVYGNGY
ncbi:hypothetical protein QR685DRAFT_446617 [Neurospora intermedia]|uniref:Uncharacterized protein n=1 Tax=Neurospora intermedia TaxID=5142 RepID=A0ABR3D8E7_NEUIN